MGQEFAKIEQGAYIESKADKKSMNKYSQQEYNFPFHTMALSTYEARLKRFVTKAACPDWVGSGDNLKASSSATCKARSAPCRSRRSPPPKMR